jgi:uncharacterized protein YndB with AHSA1/START domain
MKLQRKITIDRPIEVAWSYLVNRETWEYWYGKRIRMANWAKSALVVYSDGTGSKILEIEEGKTLKLETRTGAEAWHFTKVGENKTELLFESTFSPGTEAMIDQKFWQQGVSSMLAKMKSGIETS